MSQAHYWIIGLIFAIQPIFPENVTLAREPTQPVLEDIMTIDVWLAEPIERVKGRPWPTSRMNGEPLSLTTIQEPAHFIIHLPSGNSFESFAELATIEGGDGLVANVALWPLPELAASYGEVVDAAEALVERWGIEIKEIDKGLAEWRGMYERDPLQLPENERERIKKRFLNVEIESGIWLSLERNIHRNDRGWYLKIDIFAGEAIDRKVGSKALKPLRSIPQAD